MPAPSTVTYAEPVRTSAQTAVRDAIDAAATPGKLKLYDDADTLLATVALPDPCGSVSAGVLTITAGQTATIAASGACTWGAFTDGDDGVVVSAPVQEGAASVAGQIVLSATGLIAGATVELISCSIG